MSEKPSRLSDVIAMSKRPPARVSPFALDVNPLDDAPTVPQVPAVPRDVPKSVPTDLGAGRYESNVPAVPQVPRHSRSAKSREHRDLAQLNVSIPVELIEELKERARKERRAVADIIEQLAYEYTSRHPVVPAVPNVPRHQSDLMTDDTVLAHTNNIISHLFRQRTGKTPDQAAIVEWLRTLATLPDEWAARAGIALGLLRTKHRQINSVKYFFGSIAEVLEIPRESWRGYAEHLERKLERAGRT